MMKKLKYRININSFPFRNERFLMGVLVFSLTLTFSLLYHNRYITDASSWSEYLAIKLNQGKMPYRDFFVYTPPMIVFKLRFIWYLFGESVLFVKFAGMLERSFMILLLYVMFSKEYKPLYAFCSSLISYLIVMCRPIDTVGDYTWLTIMIILISTFLVQKFWDYKRSKSKYSFLYLFLSFFAAAQAMMAKQNIGLVYICALCLYFLIYVVCCRGKNVGTSTTTPT